MSLFEPVTHCFPVKFTPELFIITAVYTVHNRIITCWHFRLNHYVIIISQIDRFWQYYSTFYFTIELFLSSVIIQFCQFQYNCLRYFWTVLFCSLYNVHFPDSYLLICLIWTLMCYFQLLGSSGSPKIPSIMKCKLTKTFYLHLAISFSLMASVLMHPIIQIKSNQRCRKVIII